jgi:type II secretory pathway pseudopilin PulG
MIGTRSDDRGLTLVETLAAMLVFALVTLGIVPLFVSSLRGSNLSRSFTVGKNLALEAMERVRGLPFRVKSTTKRLDVLDLYFPQGDPAGLPANQTLTGNTLVTTCDDATTGSAPCPEGFVPADYTLTFTARFVTVCDAAVTATCQPVPAGGTERYETAPVDPTYAWNGNDAPPTTLLLMHIESSWELLGTGRSFEVESLISDRRFGDLKIDGSARIDHVLDMRTGFEVGAGQLSNLTVTAGESESRIESKLLHTADHASTSVRMTLVDEVLPDLASDEVVGEGESAQAPEDFGPTTLVTSDPAALLHGELGNASVADANLTSVDAVAVGVNDNTPTSEGEAGVGEGSPADPLGVLWMENQAQSGAPSRLRLADQGRVAWLRPSTTAGVGPMVASTGADSTLITASPRFVQTAADAELGSLRLLPADFTGGGFEGAVIVVDDFEANVTCSSQAAGVANPDPSATWSATFRYWTEDQANDGVTAGGYQSLALTQATNASDLTNLASDPPMVYEEDDPTIPNNFLNDIYLFPVTKTYRNVLEIGLDLNGNGTVGDLIPELEHRHAGYLSVIDLGSTSTEEDSAGRVTSARIDGALTFTTEPTNRTVDDSRISVSIGSMSCDALDAR